MKIYRFYTNIENTEDLQQVSKIFNRDRRIISFKINPEASVKVMEVSCNENISEPEVRNMVNEAGFQTSNISSEIPGSSAPV